jgi:hypothetical protein
MAHGRSRRTVRPCPDVGCSWPLHPAAQSGTSGVVLAGFLWRGRLAQVVLQGPFHATPPPEDYASFPCRPHHQRGVFRWRHRHLQHRHLQHRHLQHDPHELRRGGGSLWFGLLLQPPRMLLRHLLPVHGWHRGHAVRVRRCARGADRAVRLPGGGSLQPPRPRRRRGGCGRRGGMPVRGECPALSLPIGG